MKKNITSLIASSGITEKEYEAAKKLVIESGICKTTFLEEKFGIGYARADLLLTLLAEEGIVSNIEYPNGRRLLVNNKFMSYIYFFKCRGCRLEFSILSWSNDWEEKNKPFCPECGKQDIGHPLRKTASEKPIYRLVYDV